MPRQEASISSLLALYLSILIGREPNWEIWLLNIFQVKGKRAFSRANR
jgi:hypothetical protein